MPQVNPKIMQWARETASLSPEDACKKLNIKKSKDLSSEKKLAAIESGETAPSRSMLLRMSKHYRRPLIVFYMKEPPIKGSRGNDFRTLRRDYVESEDALVDALVRNVIARQSIVKALLEEDGDILDYVQSVKKTDSVDKIVNSIKSVTNFDLKVFRDQNNSLEAFNYLRHQVENAGIFVLLDGDLGSHHTAISTSVFRGFALSDKTAPFVVINDNDSKAAWSFTLVHELTHIWLGQTGISNQFGKLDVEKLCNEVASEFLLPKEELERLELSDGLTFSEQRDIIDNFAFTRKVSGTMVAYKLYSQDKITWNQWLKFELEYKELWNKAKREKRKEREGKKKTGGPSYYVIRKHRLGNGLISFTRQMLSEGALSTIKAGTVLGVAPKNVYGIITPEFNYR